MILNRMARGALLLAALTIVACDDDDDDITNPPGTLAVSVSRLDLDITAGSSDTLTVSITRGGSFQGDVDLAITGAPDGVTASLDTPTLSASQTSSGVTITVVAAVAPGEYPLTVTADGDNVTDPTTTITLTVVSASVADFSLAVSPDTIQLTPGDSTDAVVALTRTGGFADVVVITTDSLPAGVSATLDADSVAGDTAMIRLVASDTTPPGEYRFFVTGTADTVVRTDTVDVVVGSNAVAGFSLAAGADTIQMAPGDTASLDIVLSRTGGFADSVAITVDSLPVGLSAAIADSALGGDSTVVTLIAADTTAAGTYQILVSGTADTLSSTDTVYVVVASSVVGAARSSLEVTQLAAAPFRESYRFDRPRTPALTVRKVAVLRSGD